MPVSGDGMTEHDDIVLELTDDVLKQLVKRFLGKRACWSKYSWLLDKDVDEWTDYEKKLARSLYPSSEVESYEHAQIRMQLDFHQVHSLTFEGSLELKKTFEFPLIKGEREYCVTKGFLDLIVQVKPFSNCCFSAYKLKSVREFIIEIKTKSDFRDFGSILRQIKEYRAYYEGRSVERWTKGFQSTYASDRYYCVLSNTLPPRIQAIFSNENIFCLELDSIEPLQRKLLEE